MLTVYIADDEVWITLGLTKLLEKSGYDIWVIGTANNGITAKEEIAEFKPDILFTDIRMPGKTGLELLSEPVFTGASGPSMSIMYSSL